MMKHLVPFLLLLAVLAPSLGHGGLIGDPAPPLVIKEWIRGQPVAVESGTNITVVEIWNAAIPACRTVITNLNHLQKRFQTNGVVIVGVSDEPIEKLREFVLHDGGTNIQYHIAADEHRKTSISYMKPAQQIPKVGWSRLWSRLSRASLTWSTRKTPKLPVTRWRNI